MWTSRSELILNLDAIDAGQLVREGAGGRKANVDRYARDACFDGCDHFDEFPALNSDEIELLCNAINIVPTGTLAIETGAWSDAVLDDLADRIESQQ